MIDIYFSRVGANSYIVFNENDEGFIVDPCYSNNNGVVDHYKKLHKNIKGILITHGHFDHISALEETCKLYPNAKVYICAKEKDFLTDANLNLSLEPEFGTPNKLDFVPSNLVEVSDGELINIAGFEIKVIETPFHTKGSVCYIVASEKILFTGDTLFFTTIGRTDLPTGSNKDVNNSLKKLLSLPEEIKVYPGHGPITDLDREKAHNAYLKNI